MNYLSTQILGVFAVAVLAAAVLYAAGHAARRLGRPLPRAAMPFGIAVAMIGFTVWNDYSWASRLAARLPESVSILSRGTERQALRPWSLVVPVTTRMTALDRSAIRRDGVQVETEVLLVERAQPTRMLRVAYDCATRQQRLLAPDGGGSDWAPVDPADPVVGVACG